MGLHVLYCRWHKELKLFLLFHIGVKLHLLHCGSDRLRLFKNRVLRETVGPQREQVTGD